MSTSPSRRRGRSAVMTAATLAVALVATLLTPSAASADTHPVDPAMPTTVTSDALPTVQIDGVVWDQVIVGNRVYATGDFTSARPAGAAPGTDETPRSHILAYDLVTGELIESWAPSLNAQGFTITASADGSRIYVGGDFDRVNGITRSRIAAIDATTGALVNGFTAHANTRVEALEVWDNTLYIGGHFSAFNFQPRERLAAVNATTGDLLPWAPTVDRDVVAMVVHPESNRVIVGGSFETLNGVQTYGMGSVDAVTGASLPWAVNQIIRNRGSGSYIADLTTDGDRVYGVGWAFFAGGANANFEGIFSAHPTTGELDWVNGCRGDNYGIAVTGDVIYSVGHPHDCGMVGSLPQSNPWTWQRAMATHKHRSPHGLINARGPFSNWGPFAGRPAAHPLHWLPSLAAGSHTGTNQAAFSVTTNGDYVVLGGEFPRVNGTNQQGLVRFARAELAPNKERPLGFAELQPVITDLGPGRVRVGWTASWDRDNERLTYEVLRGASVNSSTVLHTRTVDSNWWTRPPLGFVDTTAAPGSSQTYRIRVSDPQGNVITSSATTATIPADGPVSSPYAQSVQNNGALHHWRLGEPSGTAARDWRNSNDLTLNSSLSVRNQPSALLNEPTARSTQFPGTSATSPVVATTSHWQRGPHRFSVEAWIRTTTTTGGKIIGFGSSTAGRSATDQTDRNLYMSNNGSIRFGVRPEFGERIVVASGTGYNNNQWHHVVGTLGTDGLKLYINGHLVASNPTVTYAQEYWGYWRVAGDRLTSWPSEPSREAFTGQIDEVAVYPAALTASQIQANYQASGRTGNFPPAPNVAPTANFTVVSDGLKASFDASLSTDPDGAIVSYEWDFGDGTVDTTSGAQAQHFYTEPGTYTVSLTVKDDAGDSDNHAEEITVTELFALDTFSRTLNNAWGVANVGGTWTLSGGSANFSVVPGEGRIRGDVAGANRSVSLNSVSRRDGEVNTTVALDKASTGGGSFVSVIARRASSGNEYRARVVLQPNGSVVAHLSRVVGGTDSVLTSATVPGLSYTPGQQLRIRFQYEDVHPTRLRLKVWPAGTPEPATWLLQRADDTPAALEAPGGLGILLYTSGAASNLPRVLSVTQFEAGPVGYAEPPPPPPNQAPEAEFTVGVEHLTAMFDASGSSDPDGEIVSYEWDFGDATTASGLQVEHTYAAAGTYLVTLTVTDDEGATDHVSQEVTVEEPPNQSPVASFVASVTDLTVELDGSGSTDPDGTIEAWEWDFGDGVTGSGEQVVHTYAEPGTYLVSLTVTDDEGASDAHADTVTVPPPPPANEAPVASFGASVTDLTVELDGSGSTDPDGTIEAWEWDFGDGNTGTGAQTSHTYAVAGTYTVTLTVTDDDGATGTTTDQVTVTDPDPGGPTPPPPYAADDFERVVSNGWGTADTGGAWTANVASALSVNGGTGRITSTVAGTNRFATLDTVSALDVDITTTLALDTAPSGNGTYVSLLARRQSPGNEYRALARFMADGTISVNLQRVQGNVVTRLVFANDAGITYTAGQTLRARFQIEGTTLRYKLWRDGDPEPTTWLLEATDTTPALQNPGSVGILQYISGTSNVPTTLAVDSYRVSVIPAP